MYNLLTNLAFKLTYILSFQYLKNKTLTSFERSTIIERKKYFTHREREREITLKLMR